jgi:Tfp pilus assembly protein PilE
LHCRPGVAVQLPPHPLKTVRRGMTLVELAVAGALLGTLLVVCLQLLAATAEQRRSVDQRQLAVLEVENAMERLAARPWTDLTPQAVAPPQLSPSARNRLPGAEWKIEVTAPSNEPLAKRIAVSLRWQDHAGQFVKPVRIVTWRWKGKE